MPDGEQRLNDSNQFSDLKSVEAKAQEFTDLVEKRIAPSKLTAKQKASLRVLARKYDLMLLLDCVDIGITNYIEYDTHDVPTESSVDDFVSLLGGIAYNKTRTPLDKEVTHIMNICKNEFNYWDPSKGKAILNDLIITMRDAGYSSEEITNFLKDDVKLMTRSATSWTRWRNAIDQWIEDFEEP